MKNLLWLAVLCSTAFGAVTISGTVTDTASNAMQGASITLTGLSASSFAESTITAANGSYGFDSVPALATYKLSFRLAGYVNRDSSIVVGNDNKTCNIELAPVYVPAGTLHSGLVSGTWLPSGNPHRINDTAIIKDSLFIAPGCTLLFAKVSYPLKGCLMARGNLIIGSRGGPMCYIDGGSIRCDDSSFSVRINNTKTNSTDFPLRCATIMLDSVDIWFACPYTTNSFRAVDSIIVADTKTDGDRKLGLCISGCSFTGNYIRIDNSNFFAPISFKSDSKLAVRYSVLKDLSFYWPKKEAIVNHCTIYSGGMSGPMGISDTFSNNIVFQFNVRDTAGTSNSTFRCNLFNRTPSILPIFGLLTNARENVNGDSCDIWFNMLTDPLIVDSSSGLPDSISPAIGAACDGSNIGFYQGNGTNSSVVVPPRTKGDSKFLCIYSLHGRKILVPATHTASPFTLLISDLSGRIHYRKKFSGNQAGSPLPLSLSAGTYFGLIMSKGKILTSKFVLHD